MAAPSAPLITVRITALFIKPLHVCRAVRASAGGVGAAALEFAILTAARSGEVRGATWDEFNLTEKRWTIPATRMKSGKEHLIPLSAPAVAVIERMQEQQLVLCRTWANNPTVGITMEINQVL